MNDDIPVASTVDDRQQASLPEPLIKYGWLRAVLFMVAAIPYYIIVGLIAVLILGMDRAMDMESFMDSTDLMHDPTMILIQVGLMLGSILLAFVFWKIVDRRSIVSLGFSFDRQSRVDLLAGMTWGAALIIVVAGFLYLNGSLVVVSVQLPVGALAQLVLIFAIAGASEEVIMRGYLLNNFMASMNRYLALALVSVLFALVHGANPNMSMAGLLNIILAGVLLGIYYVHRQNLWFPIGMHFTWNFFQGGVIGSHVSGVETDAIFTTVVQGDKLLTGGEFGFEASLVTTVVAVLAIVGVHLIYRRENNKAQEETTVFTGESKSE